MQAKHTSIFNCELLIVDFQRRILHRKLKIANSKLKTPQRILSPRGNEKAT